MLRDIAAGEAQVQAVVAVLAAMRPDILLLTGIDHDHGQAALDALAGRLQDAGLALPHRFARRPNSGMASGLDLDGDGRRGRPEDAQGYGWFAGEGGMAILSRLPIRDGEARDFSALLWRDLPGALIGDAGLTPEAAAAQRLSSVAHWAVPVEAPGGPLTLLAFSATPPVFDGPEDRNGRRNRDEAALWLHYLDGGLGPVPEGPVVVLGNANLDPADGEGRRDALAALLAHPRLQDPAPRGPGGAAAPDPGHGGDPALDTADWDDPPGNLRVDYVLPDRRLAVRGAGVFWPAPDDPMAAVAAAASAHRPVWVDVEVPDG